ncbi:AAA family ATPase [Thalassobacillus pellis]|uniref:AAA family ATPase n=1 Tax=Thalassobacillus pellis TaxID=748008 RepID=UPI001961FE5A|nr:stage V sporulation protein K [Thalassobacillus pellis]
MNSHLSVKQQGQINIILRDHNKQAAEGTAVHAETEANPHPFQIVDDHLASFVGMDRLRGKVKEIYAQVLIAEKRKQAGLSTDNQVLHMMFRGNPGTGKTTVARALAKIFYDMKLLSKGHFVEADRGDLVGEYIGHTAQKTKALIKKSLGGVLFIDEAYSLARGGEKDFGKEAVDTIVKCMEDHHSEFILILAGYPKEMSRFLSLNPGLKSRFPITLDFPDYTSEELLEISMDMVKTKDYKLSKEAQWKLKNHFHQMLQRLPHNFSNGRYVRNLIEEAIRKHATRVIELRSPSKETLMTLDVRDIVFEEK